MKTVIYSDIDGYQVVKYFAEAQVDPIVTMAKVSDKVLGLNELAQVNSVKAKVIALLISANNFTDLSNSANKTGNTTLAASYQKQSSAARAQVAVLEEEYAKVLAAYEKARNSIIEANSVFFTPGPGESFISDENYAALKNQFDALHEDEKLCINGVVIKDLRDKTFWTKGTKWESMTISSLGQGLPAGAILESDLDESQRAEISSEYEAARISGMTADEKNTEKAIVLNNAARDALQKKGIAEITKEIFDAQAWYAEKKLEIEAKYA